MNKGVVVWNLVWPRGLTLIDLFAGITGRWYQMYEDPFVEETSERNAYCTVADYGCVPPCGFFGNQCILINKFNFQNLQLCEIMSYMTQPHPIPA